MSSDERKPRRAEVPADAPEADVAEQSRDWKDDEDDKHTEVPIDAPEADFLDQERSAGIDDDERDRGQ